MPGRQIQRHDSIRTKVKFHSNLPSQKLGAHKANSQSHIYSETKSTMTPHLDKQAEILEHDVTYCCTCAQAKHDPRDHVSERGLVPPLLMTHAIPNHDEQDSKVLNFIEHCSMYPTT
jgi:hypothetical protein